METAQETPSQIRSERTLRETPTSTDPTLTRMGLTPTIIRSAAAEETSTTAMGLVGTIVEYSRTRIIRIVACTVQGVESIAG